MPLCELTTLAEPVIKSMTYLKLASVGLGEAGKLSPQEFRVTTSLDLQGYVLTLIQLANALLQQKSFVLAIRSQWRPQSRGESR